ncbi:MAG: hypothetical protein ACK4FA_00800 [Candidatus Paceibacteria bacterium]
MKINKNHIFYNITTVLGVILVWRGVWHMLDKIDLWLFGGSHFWTSVVGFVLGLVILYLPDKDLKEIGRM